MQALSRTAAALILGAACTLPAVAQGTAGSSGVGKSSQQQTMPSSQPGAAATPSTATPSTPPDASQPDTRSMGAGPAMDDTPRGEDKKDLGWLGLLGLAGLLGLRRKHDDHHYTTTDNARRPTTNH